MSARVDDGVLRPYVPRVLDDWLIGSQQSVHRVIDGTAVFADISGFTRLTERLARHGHVGAEELSDALDATFGHLLEVAYAHGADLIKWGGDAVLLLFDGVGHQVRAVTAAYGMRARLREVGHLTTSVGHATLRMSMGVHTGAFHLFLIGDPALHRELVMCGPDVTRVVRLEALANAGDIAVGHATVAALGGDLFGDPAGDLGRMLRRTPHVIEPWHETPRAAVDVASCLPVAIREHVLLGAGEPEHRSIAVAFVGFAGTDELLRADGAEVTAHALDEMVRNVSHAVAAYDVTFFESDVAVDGGKIMLTAGAPRSAGHDVERMLRAARVAVDRAGRLPLRVGVNTGHVFAGDFGPPFRRTYSVKGDAVNLAARVQSRARPGQVLVTSEAYAHSSTAFDALEIEPFRVKGKAAPVHAVAIGDLVGDRGETAGPGVLVGRQQEMAVLGEALERVRRRQGGVVLLLGEPGIGKSRLMTAVTAQAQDLCTLTVQCDEYAASTPYLPFRTLFRELLGIAPHTPPELAMARLTSRVQFNAPRLVPWLPLLGTLLDLEFPDTTETVALEEQFRKRRLEEVTCEFLHALLPTPTLVTVDDAHSMDGASADLLTRLAAKAADDSWLFVIGRRGAPAGWDEDAAFSHVTTLRLAPLTSEDSMALARSATAGQPLPKPTLEALAAKAGGNPLFLASLVAAAGSTGTVDGLPQSVEELVTAQIDRLAPRDRAMLRRASVLGLRFGTGELSGLLDARAGTLTDTAFLRLTEFLEPETPTTMRFRHAIIREVAYEGLPYRLRQRLHDEVGSALEVAGEADANGPELLSMHFFHAGRYDKAWRYSRDAGHRARSKYANNEAVEFLRRAIESESRGRNGMVPPEELGDVLEDLAETYYTIGLLDEAITFYARARRQFADDPVRASRSVARQADVERRLRHLPQSLGRITAALNRIGTTDRGTEACMARAQLAVRYAMGRFAQSRFDDALRWSNRAVDEAQDSCDKSTLAQAYATIHQILTVAHRDGDLPYGELALQAYVELGDLTGQGRCLTNLAVSAFDRFRWVEAAEMFARAAAIYRRLGDTASEANANFNVADVLVRQGKLAAARGLLGEVVVTARSVSDIELVALALREIGRCDSRLGEPDTGVAALQEARQVFADIEEPDEVDATDLALAEAWVHRGDVGTALEVTVPLLDGSELLAPGVRWVRGLAYLASGRSVEAGAEFEAGVSGSEATGDHYVHALNVLGLSRVVTLDGRLDAARDTLAWLGVEAVPFPESPGQLLATLTAPGS